MPSVICMYRKIINRSEYGCIANDCPLDTIEAINNNWTDKECDYGVIFLEWTEYILYKNMFIIKDKYKYDNIY